MRNIDIRVLREAAEKALNARARLALMQSVFDDDGDDVKPEAQEDISICVSFNDLTNPATVLALLDELEDKDKRTKRALSLLSDANTENFWDVIGRLKVVISGDYRSEAEIASAKGDAS